MRPFLFSLLSLVLSAAGILDRCAEDLDAAPWPSLPAIGVVPEALLMPASEPELPPCTLADLARFPGRADTRLAVWSIHAHLCWLDDALMLHPLSGAWESPQRLQLLAVRDEVRTYSPAWEKLDFVWTPPVGPPEALEGLRVLVGRAAYERGEMPGPPNLRTMAHQ